jgi:Fe-S-cluster containining protein
VLGAPTGSVPCLSCALCCSYVAIEIDAPDTVRVATDILFYLYHDHVSVYVEDDEWVVQLETRCQHLLSDNRCAIYETRPPMCREYDPRDCEVNASHRGRLFVTADEFLSYLAEHEPRICALVRKQYAPGPGAARRKARGGFASRDAALRARAGHGP